MRPRSGALLSACAFFSGLLLAVPSVASAAEFSLGGYYRMRLELFKSLSGGVGFEGVPEDRTTGYWQHRVRLDPRIKLNDNISFFVQMDMLDNTIAGDYPESGTSFEEEALPEFFSQGILPQNDVAGDTRRNISVKRAWGEVLTGVGQLKFGRMGSHWGLGILANDGNGWDDDTGDTVDRIMFVTKAGPIYIVPMIDKIAEGPLYSTPAATPADENDATLSDASDDVDEFVLVAVYRGELSSAGVYGVLRYQPSTEAQVMIGDAWAKTRLGPVAVEAEAVYLTGKSKNFIALSSPPEVTATQWGFAVETEIPLKAVSPGFDFGAASGDKGGASNGDINGFTFDRNYRIAFLMFRYVGVYQGPKAITNAAYARPNVRWEVFDNFVVDAALVYAQTMVKSTTNQEGTYGTELDLGVTWRLYEDFEAGFRYAALAPGEALRRPDGQPTSTGKLDPVIHGLEGRFLIRF